VVTLSSDQVVEAAMVGRDGVIGASAALDGKVALSRAVSRQNATKYGGCNVYGQPSLGTDLEYYEVSRLHERGYVLG
jgi:hypothetical protein